MLYAIIAQVYYKLATIGNRILPHIARHQNSAHPNLEASGGCWMYPFWKIFLMSLVET